MLVCSFGFVGKVFAADTTLYVNTASTAGGTCTTNATTGADRACATLSEAESKLPADITAAGGADAGVWTIMCEGQAADTQAVTFQGTVTDATHYIVVTTDPDATYGRHQGMWSDTKYRLYPANATALSINNDDYVYIQNIQIGKSSSSATEQSCIYISSINSSNLVNISGVICRQAGNASYAEPGIYVRDADANVNVWNTIIYGGGNYNTCRVPISSDTSSILLSILD